MANNRANKSGFAAEAHAKIKGKYDTELATQVMTWISQRLRDGGSSESVDCNGDHDYVAEVLNDGYILCELCRVLGINVAGKVARSKMAFKKMELIGKYLDAIQAYGVDKMETFQTVDLYEQQNMTQVVLCIAALARKVQSKGGPGFGPKEATENKRDFTDEQMKAGQNVIGLQMGTNKGANQSGINFGKGRMIMD